MERRGFLATIAAIFAAPFIRKALQKTEQKPELVEWVPSKDGKFIVRTKEGTEKRGDLVWAHRASTILSTVKEGKNMRITISAPQEFCKQNNGSTAILEDGNRGVFIHTKDNEALIKPLSSVHANQFPLKDSIKAGNAIILFFNPYTNETNRR